MFNPASFIQGMIANNPNIGSHLPQNTRQQILNAVMSGDPSQMEQIGRQQAQQMGISENDVRNSVNQFMQNQQGGMRF